MTETNGFVKKAQTPEKSICRVGIARPFREFVQQLIATPSIESNKVIQITSNPAQWLLF
jgi:hypothetical protein